MALDVGLQHAVSGSRSQSGFSIPSLLKGRCPAGSRHLTQETARPAGIGLLHTSSQLPTSAASVAAAATMFMWVVEQGSLSCLR